MANNLNELIESFNQVSSDEELFRCINLKKVFMLAKDKSLPNNDRIEHLINALLISTGYEERLVAMKISCKSIRTKVKIGIDKKRNSLATNDDDFFKKRKCDQERLVAIHTEKMTSFLAKIDSRLERIEDALEYVRNAAFNVKSVMSVLKEYLSG